MNMMNNNRCKYVDIAKGIGIFLVVFGHVTHDNSLREYIWNFHMPLFFFISGLLYNADQTFALHIKRRVKSIIIPYVCFYLITWLYWVVVERHVRGGEFPILHQLIGLPYGTYSDYMYFNGALWFLPCLFITDFLFAVITKIVRRRNVIVIISCVILCFCLGTWFVRNGITYLPFGINTALFAIVFYAIGFHCKFLFKLPVTLNRKQKLTLIFFVSTIVVVQLQCLGVIHGNIEKTDLAYILLAIIGIALCIALSILIKENKIIEYLGTNSLIIFVFQEQMYRAVLYCMSTITKIPVETIRCNFGGAFIITIISIICILPFILTWNKWMKPLLK